MNRTLRLIGAVVLVPLWLSDSISETGNIPPDRDGRPIRTVFSSPAGHHTAFSLTTQFPELANRVGMMVVSAQAPPHGFLLKGFQLLGFRFNPDGPFTTISPMLSVDESLELG